MKKKILLLVLLLILIISPITKSYGEEKIERSSITICIDPGHQEKGDKRGEPISPNSSEMKARVSQGTVGISSKTPEYVVNLNTALILKEILIKEGYNVVMTRESNDVNISNSERAQISNENNAAMTIRIHCDSIKDCGKTGSVILIPDSKSNNNKAIFEESNRYALILKEKMKGENLKVNGIFERKDMTGFNWSKVPVVILEMGFMSNYNEDCMLNSKEYQTKLMNCVKDSLNKYFTTS